MGYLKALTGKRLWVNVFVAVLFFGLVLWLALIFLNVFTRHGERVLVPDLSGLTYDEAVGKLDKRGLNAVIVDSVFTNKVARGTVFAQTPRSDQEVKPERKIYITMNSPHAKMLKMPDLITQSKRQAITMLEIIGLQLGELEEKPDPCNGCVLEQKYNGKPIQKGTAIRQGEKIDLILGAGRSSDVGVIPDVIGATYSDASARMRAEQFNIGLIGSCEGCNSKEDSTLAKVYRIAPGKIGGTLPRGSVIDVWLTTDVSMFTKKNEEEH